MLYSKQVLFLLATVLISACASLPQSPEAEIQLITTGYGPEDIVLENSEIKGDSISSSILISCSSRREEYPQYGEIERYFPGDSATTKLNRKNEPDSLIFRPHGISISENEGENYLYVISHDDENDSHPVLKYKVEKNTLILQEIFNHPYLVSPNALHAFSNGSFLVCNDAEKRNSTMDKILRLKKSNIVYYDGKENWSVVAQNLGMVAGLGYKDGKLYASAALENKIYVFDFVEGKLLNKKMFKRIKGPDNIHFHTETLLVTSHFKFIKFIKHVSNPENKSPSLVYSIDLNSGEKSVIYSDPGEQISAASAAVLLSGKLYVSQIFEPWIIELDLGDR